MAGKADPTSTPAHETLPAGRTSAGSAAAEPSLQVSSRLPLDKGTLLWGRVVGVGSVRQVCDLSNSVPLCMAPGRRWLAGEQRGFHWGVVHQATDRNGA